MTESKKTAVRYVIVPPKEKSSPSPFKERIKALHGNYAIARDSQAFQFLRRDRDRLTRELSNVKAEATKLEKTFATENKEIVACIITEARRNKLELHELVRESSGRRKTLCVFTSKELAEERIESEKKLDKDAGKVATYKTLSFVPTGAETIELLDISTAWTV